MHAHELLMLFAYNADLFFRNPEALFECHLHMAQFKYKYYPITQNGYTYLYVGANRIFK